MLFRSRMALAEKLSEGAKAFKTLYGHSLDEFDRAYRSLTRLNELLEKQFRVNLQNDADSLDAQMLQTQRWMDNLDKLKDWTNWNRAMKRATEAGFGEFIAFMLTQQDIRVKSLFLKSVYHSVIQSAVDAQPELSQFSGKIFEDRIGRFRKLTKDFETLMRKELYAILAANIPSFIREASQGSEVGILQRAIHNKGRGISLRRLFDSIPGLLPRLAPCM